MEKVARIGDIVVGYCNGSGHTSNRAFTGVWVTGSDTLFADEIAVVRVGDSGVTDCNHEFIAVTGSDIYDDSNGLKIHRIGDVVLITEGGVGVTVSGSDTTDSE